MRLTRPSAPNVTSITGADDDGIPAYNGGTTYALGARMRKGDRFVYKSIQAGNMGHGGAVGFAPDPLWWAPDGVTSAYMMFDEDASSRTLSQTGSIVAVFAAVPLANTVAILNVLAAAANVTITSGGVEVYNVTQSAFTPGLGINDWYEYFFGDTNAQTDFIFADLPVFPNAIITVTVAGAGTVAIGTLAVGFGYFIGDTLTGAKIGINNYSRKNVDEFGAVTVVKRGFSKIGSFSVLVTNDRVDFIANLLPQYRDEALVWIGDDAFGSTFIYGFYKSFAVEIQHGQVSICSLEIEGLV